jgi:RNA polymerase sigma-70 factor (ECF subfamily)
VFVGTGDADPCPTVWESLLRMLLILLAFAHHLSDAELVSRFKEGDRHAFSEIVRRYQDRVYTLAFRWMRDRQVAEEVAQDVFLALFRSLARFRGDSQLSTWIYRVVVNHCKNRKLYRSRRKVDQHEALEGERDDGLERQIPAEGPGTDASVHRDEARALLMEALDKLDDSQREIILLRDIHDLGYEEISEMLDLPRGTVKSRLHRARQHLAKVLSRHLSTEDIV